MSILSVDFTFTGILCEQNNYFDTCINIHESAPRKRFVLHGDKQLCNFKPPLSILSHDTDRLYLMIIQGYFASILHKTYVMGTQQNRDSNEYTQHTFLWRNMENYR